jgi:hypothetical protein
MKRWIACTLFLLTSVALQAQSSNSILIAAAGHVQGANGTFFKSDIAIHNLRPVTQLVRVEWLPRSGTGAYRVTSDITILGDGVAQTDDFVEGLLSTEGLGSIVVAPVLADGTPDTAGRLAVTSRIWTPQPGTNFGNVSQSFPPLPFSRIVSTKLAITGLRSDTQHRVNIGIVNLDRTSTQTFRVSMPGLPAMTREVTVEPYSMTQFPLDGFFAGGNLRVNVEVLPLPGGGLLSLWTAYGSVVDNGTGDSWSSIGIETTDR